jgi:hypothetical protein
VCVCVCVCTVQDSDKTGQSGRFSTGGYVRQTVIQEVRVVA